jgi:hypothetical protein
LSPEILRDHGVIGADLLLDVYARVQELLGDDETLLIWFGFPNREQRKAIAELALMIAHRRQERSGLHTPGQIGWAWSQLRVIKTLPKFLRWFAGTFFQADKAAGVDAAFQFLQACEFGFPRSLAAVEALVRQARPGAEMSYGPYIAAMESWFRPAWLKELDESGIPLPLGERLAAYLSHPRDRADAIQQLEALDLNEIQALDGIDRFILHLATER